jgi:hypothetical protein
MAITTKARAKGLLRDARALLADRTLPKDVVSALETVSAALKKNWADLAAEVDGEDAADAVADAAEPAPAAAGVQEAESPVVGEIVPLVERAVRADGTVPL